MWFPRWWGIAIYQGYIKSVNEPIGEYFTAELSADGDGPKAGITIEDLLTMQSGLETTSNRNYGAWVMSSDWVDFALRQPLELPPGLVMEYSTGNTHLLSAILTRATGMSTLEFAREALSEPLGFRLASWPRDPQGIFFGGNDMEMTPRQMLEFGELYLNDGRANGTQIVPADWVAASLRPLAKSTRENNRSYGYGWWIRDMAGHRTPYAWGLRRSVHRAGSRIRARRGNHLFELSGSGPTGSYAANVRPGGVRGGGSGIRKVGSRRFGRNGSSARRRVAALMTRAQRRLLGLPIPMAIALFVAPGPDERRT